MNTILGLIIITCEILVILYNFGLELPNWLRIIAGIGGILFVISFIGLTTMV